jgi:hypothetical protein
MTGFEPNSPQKSRPVPRAAFFVVTSSVATTPAPLPGKPVLCYHERISQKQTHTHMSIETCIAHAIHRDLDIVEALPEIKDLPMDELEPYVEQYVLYVQELLVTVVRDKGDKYIRAKDAAGLCAACIDAGVSLPPRMLLRMCQTIMNLSSIDAKFILDTEEGKSLYFVKMALA